MDIVFSEKGRKKIDQDLLMFLDEQLDEQVHLRLPDLRLIYF